LLSLDRTDDICPDIACIGVPELRDLRGHDSSMRAIREYANVIPSAALPDGMFVSRVNASGMAIILGNYPERNAIGAEAGESPGS
jgi:hypothetical protein